MKKIEISHRTIIFTVLFLIFLWLLYFIRDIILIFFISLLIMTILNPTVERLSQLRIPRGLSVLVVYVLAITIVILTFAGIVPPLVDQSTRFANSLPSTLSSVGLSTVVSEQVARELISQFSTLPGQLIKVGVSIFSNLVAVLTVLIIAFYLLLSRYKLDDQIAALVGSNRAKIAIKVIDNLEKKLGGWARGQLALMILVGLLTFIGLTLIGIPYSLPLALLAAIFEIVPNIGPFIAAIPAVIIGFGISPVIGLATVALAILVQQIENYIFVPKVMEKSVGVSPVITLLAIAIGLKLAGIVGVLISVPVYITIQVLLKEYFALK